MIDIKEILEKHQKLIAEKYKLGKNLVMGHKKGYFDEASENAIKEIITEVLREAADNAEIETHYSNPYTDDHYERVNEKSITSVINKVKF